MSLLKETIIRSATSKDANDIVKVHIKCWQEAYKGIIDQKYLDNMSSSFDARLQIRNELLTYQNNNLCLVAEYKGNIIGFCDAAPSSSDIPNIKGEIQTMYLLEEYTNQGIGTELWKQAVSYLVSNDLSPFSFLVLNSSSRARRFCEKQGGRPYRKEVSEIGGRAYEEIRYIFNKF